MARPQRIFSCQSCGHRHSQWAGRCDGCEEWNTLIEEVQADVATAPHRSAARGRVIDYVSLSQTQPELSRWTTGLGEFDRVCGGGLVPGSVILLGGDPGIGKSTLLLQAMAKLAPQHAVAYISGEESIDQIQRRAHRLGLSSVPVDLASETNVSHILATLKEDGQVRVVVIDSIQTLFNDAIESATGTVSQVRTCAHLLIQHAKKHNVVVILVGHVTKEGTIAGPKVLEHMVDTVLYFEGERGHHFRILRAVKNRFGPCNEIGVFEMAEAGLQEVTNPSALFLSGRSKDSEGSAVFAGMEGTRPLLVEVQALVSSCPYGTPRRSVIGWDPARLNMILAVIEARCGISYGNKDVYLNIAGGLKMTEPGVDLAAAASLLSALSGEPVPLNSVFCGEIGLSGEVRIVQAMDMRLKEAAKLGFTAGYIAQRQASQIALSPPELTVYDVKHIRELLPLFVNKRQQPLTQENAS